MYYMGIAIHEIKLDLLNYVLERRPSKCHGSVKLDLRGKFQTKVKAWREKTPSWIVVDAIP